jgi:hypothetical protein
MNFLNMFSDEAPISNNGYRSSLYTDPSIQQGVNFLNYEKNITDNLSGNLRLISQTDGSNLRSGQVINGKVYEGMETTGTTPTPATMAATAATSAAPGAPATSAAPATPAAPAAEVMEDKDIEYLKMSYDMVNSFYQDILRKFRKDYQGGIANTLIGSNGSAIIGQRNQIVQAIQNIESSLGVINVQISGIVKRRSKANIDAYYTIMEQIKQVKTKIINANNQIENLTKMVDPVSAVAEREETHILSKQRYYIYIFWFIIAAIVIYVTIVNMINPDASFSILAVCIIILLCIFGFIMYNNITGRWFNDIKNGIRGISLPRIGNSFQNLFNFDPLVSIKYTS